MWALLLVPVQTSRMVVWKSKEKCKICCLRHRCGAGCINRYGLPKGRRRGTCTRTLQNPWPNLCRFSNPWYSLNAHAHQDNEHTCTHTHTHTHTHKTNNNNKNKNKNKKQNEFKPKFHIKTRKLRHIWTKPITIPFIGQTKKNPYPRITK